MGKSSMPAAPLHILGVGLLKKALEEDSVVVAHGQVLWVVQLPAGNLSQPLVQTGKILGINDPILVVVKELGEEVGELVHLEGGEPSLEFIPVHRRIVCLCGEVQVWPECNAHGGRSPATPH